ncbi:MAG TPA: DUF5615 family PIN-like protein [Ktedonobacterales bacterium]|nr:DUF5615 family PIN-like protein [Ktedonobacterales bacterium]
MKLLLDEHVAVAVARGLDAVGCESVALRDWHGGGYLETADDVILRAAYMQAYTLVTYDLRTLPPLLKQWSEQGIAHGGVVFVDQRTIAPNDIGGLIRGLRRLVEEHGDDEWTCRVMFLSR